VNGKQPWIVLYQMPGIVAEPLSFACEAADMDEADEQCQAAHPGCVIPWSEPGTSHTDAVEHWVDSMQAYFTEAETETNPS